MASGVRVQFANMMLRALTPPITAKIAITITLRFIRRRLACDMGVKASADPGWDTGDGLACGAGGVSMPTSGTGGRPAAVGSGAGGTSMGSVSIFCSKASAGAPDPSSGPGGGVRPWIVSSLFCVIDAPHCDSLRHAPANGHCGVPVGYKTL